MASTSQRSPGRSSCCGFAGAGCRARGSSRATSRRACSGRSRRFSPRRNTSGAPSTSTATCSARCRGRSGRRSPRCSRPSMRRSRATNPNRPTRRRLWSRGCDGFASSRSCRALPAAFGAGSRCRLPPHSATRGAGPQRSSLCARRQSLRKGKWQKITSALRFSVLPKAIRTAYCATESRLPLCAY